MPRVSSRVKIQALKGTRMLRQGKLMLHTTATVAGVTARLDHAQGLRRLQHFKQRNGPFLLLASSIKKALSLARCPTTALRMLAHQHWPGPVTLVFPARTGLPSLCYQGSYIAVRVDAATAVRQLAAYNKGLIISSSFNRRGRCNGIANRRSRFRMASWIDGFIAADTVPTGSPSSLYRIHGQHIQQLR